EQIYQALEYLNLVLNLPVCQLLSHNLIQGGHHQKQYRLPPTLLEEGQVIQQEMVVLLLLGAL
ncbi:hypothetical protein AOA60_14680, partial [Pseudomonas sp. 2822-17]